MGLRRLLDSREFPLLILSQPRKCSWSRIIRTGILTVVVEITEERLVGDVRCCGGLEYWMWALKISVVGCGKFPVWLDHVGEGKERFYASSVFGVA